VTLAVVADPTISGQQSFVIDRGEMVHTPDAAKAILAAQVAAFPAEVEDTYEYEEDEAFEAEAEFEGDDEETAEGQVSGEPATTEGDGEPRRKRRRRRRGGRGEPRDNAVPNGNATEALAAPDSGEDNDEGDDDSEEPGAERNGEQRAEGAGGERRPRRRGRRGGRRRRGGPDNGQPDAGIAATITDDFGSPPISESAEAVADLSSQNDTPRRDERPARESAPEPVSHYISTPDDSRQEQDAPRKRSTVREKATAFFGGGRAESEAQPVEATSPASPAPVGSETTAAPDDSGDQPRRAGWWSKRGE